VEVHTEQMLVESTGAKPGSPEPPAGRQQKDCLAAGGVEHLGRWIVTDRPISQVVGNGRRREERATIFPERRTVARLDHVADTSRLAAAGHATRLRAP
jgi:hypothetical protein